MQYKLSKSDWKEIGQKMGWLKAAQQDPEHTYNMGDGHQYGDWEETDTEGGPIEVSYSLMTTEGVLESKGRFTVESSSDMGIDEESYMLNIDSFIESKLDKILRRKPCGPDGPIEIVRMSKNLRYTRKLSDTELEYEAIGHEGVTCGAIFVRRVDGKPFGTDSN